MPAFLLSFHVCVCRLDRKPFLFFSSPFPSGCSAQMRRGLGRIRPKVNEFNVACTDIECCISLLHLQPNRKWTCPIQSCTVISDRPHYPTSDARKVFYSQDCDLLYIFPNGYHETPEGEKAKNTPQIIIISF